jgi:fibronectin-binding autotransporter adhesin
MRYTGFTTLATIVAAMFISADTHPVRAATYTWDGGDGASQAWSTDSNWAPDASKPVSSLDTIVIIDGNNNPGTSGSPINQDIASPLLLNMLRFTNPLGGGDPAVEHHQGGSALEFVPDSGASQPIIQGNHKGNANVWNDVAINATTLTVKSQTWNVQVRGVVSGAGQLVFDPTLGGGGIALFSGANSYSGGTVWTSNGTTWKRLYANESGCLGSGPVTISGGGFTSWVSGAPSAFTFHNAGKTHANNFALAGDAAMSIGNSDTAGHASFSVDLTGDVNLGNFTLYVRGRGTGTLSGIVSGTGDMRKIDPFGTWILAGNNNFTGASMVEGGVLQLTGSLANGDLIVDGGTFNGSGTVHYGVDGAASDVMDLNGGTLDISLMALDIDVGAGGAIGPYVVVDYSGGGTFTHAGAPSYFASVVDMPTGFQLMDIAGDQQLVLVKTTYTWDGGDGSSQDWSADGNWDADGSKPVSGSNTIVIIDGNNNVGTSGAHLNQNIASPLKLNKFQSRNPATGPDPTVHSYSGGGPLEFAPNDEGTQPVVQGNRKGMTYIHSDVTIDATTLTVKNQTYGIVFNGKVSGPGQIVFDPTFGFGGLELANTANDYTGGTLWSSDNTQWKRFSLLSSHCMGSGPVTISGGSLAAYANPGNIAPSCVLIRNGDQTHTNDFTLAGDAPISIGNPETPAHSTYTVDLQGDFSLGSHTLYVRGRGAGTISGSISGSGGVTKIDDFGPGQVNAWTLSGINTYTGGTTVEGGTLIVSGTIANGNVTVNDGTFQGDGTVHFNIDGGTTDLMDLNGGTLDVSQMTLDFDVGAGGVIAPVTVVDYSGGGIFAHAGAPDYFAGLVNPPSGFELNDDPTGKKLELRLASQGTVFVVR